MGTSLPRSTPAEQDVDSAAVLAFVDAVEADPEIELHSLMVLRHGYVVAEGWWAPHAPERTRQLYSLSKSFTSTALGLAVKEGLVGLDDTVVSHFPELDADIADPRSRSVTVRHLAAMASGHGREMREEAFAADPREPVRGFLLVPPEQEPGSVFAYSQPCTYTIGSLIQREARMGLSEYLRPRLFDPLGIDDVGWLTWPPGREQGFSGLFARTEDVAKLGQLYLRRGRWEDAQLLPEWYVAEATSRQVDTPREERADWRQGYGFQFWMARHGYRGDGAFGQFCIVLPDQDAVIAITGGTEAMQAVLDHLWEHLLPGFAAAPPSGAMQAALDERLRSLSLPPCPGRPPGRAWSEDTAAHFAVRPASGAGRAPLVGVALASGDAGLEITLAQTDDVLTLPVGAGEWLVSERADAQGDPVPVAASAGCPDARTLRVEVLFLESPHRMDIVCSLPDRTAEASWRGESPLDGGGLRTLHRPRA